MPLDEVTINAIGGVAVSVIGAVSTALVVVSKKQDKKIRAAVAPLKKQIEECQRKHDRCEAEHDECEAKNADHRELISTLQAVSGILAQAQGGALESRVTKMIDDANQRVKANADKREQDGER